MAAHAMARRIMPWIQRSTSGSKKDQNPTAVESVPMTDCHMVFLSVALPEPWCGPEVIGGLSVMGSSAHVGTTGLRHDDSLIAPPASRCDGFGRPEKTMNQVSRPRRGVFRHFCRSVKPRAVRRRGVPAGLRRIGHRMVRSAEA